MIAGTIVGITILRDRIRFTVDDLEKPKEATLEVYKTGTALAAMVGDSVWTQSMRAYLNRPNSCYRDAELWQIRQDDGADEPWPLEEAQFKRRHVWQGKASRI